MQPLPNSKILIVDDHLEFYQGLKEKLIGKGYTVEEAESPQKALQSLQEEKFSLAIVDLHFGEKLLGFDLIEKIKNNKNNNTAIVVATIDNKASTARRALKELEAIEYLEKQYYDVNEWLNTLEKLLQPIASAFLSYSHKDAAFAIRLEEELNQRRILVVKDTHFIRGGDEIDERIEYHIREADFYIVVLSKQSQNSSYVKNEIAFALSTKDKEKVIPICWENVSLPLRLSGKRCIDFSHIHQYIDEKLKIAILQQQKPLDYSAIDQLIGNRCDEVYHTILEKL